MFLVTHAKMEHMLLHTLDPTEMEPETTIGLLKGIPILIPARMELFLAVTTKIKNNVPNPALKPTRILRAAYLGR